MICQYCNQPAKCVPNEEIYNGKRYGKSYMMWYCKPCDAYVGTHNNNPDAPLGTLANRELRTWRKLAHKVFDPIWKTKIMTRKQAYRRLANRMKVKQIHIGESDIETCEKIVDLITSGKLKSGYFGNN